MTARIAKKLGATVASLFALVLMSFFWVATPASASASNTADVGVFVDPTIPPPVPTTAAPVTTVKPPVTTAPATTVTTPATTATTSTDDSLAAELPTPSTTPAPAKTGFVSSVKSAARTTSAFVKGIASGQAVADVAQAVLPAQLANIVVPGVRTASTFAFPIGLAGAVIAFLGLQARIDSSDPKLSAAPLAHDDDSVTFL